MTICGQAGGLNSLRLALLSSATTEPYLKRACSIAEVPLYSAVVKLLEGNVILLILCLKQFAKPDLLISRKNPTNGRSARGLAIRNTRKPARCMWLLTKFGSPEPWTKEQVHVYVAKMRAELKKCHCHVYQRARRVWARKPFPGEVAGSVS